MIADPRIQKTQHFKPPSDDLLGKLQGSVCVGIQLQSVCPFPTGSLVRTQTLNTKFSEKDGVIHLSLSKEL